MIHRSASAVPVKGGVVLLAVLAALIWGLRDKSPDPVGCEDDLGYAEFAARKRGVGVKTEEPLKEPSELEEWRTLHRRLRPTASVAGAIRIRTFVYLVGAGPDLAAERDLLSRQIDHLNRAFEGSPFVFDLSAIRVDRTPLASSMRKLDARDVALRGRFTGVRADLHIFFVGVRLLSARGAEASGWARKPYDDSSPSVDGVVMSLGVLPGRSRTWNEGDTLVHEVGHWLGLDHTFHGQCSVPNDDVEDTAAHRSPSPGCSRVEDTCRSMPGPDPSDNFMTNGADECRRTFTQRQVDRMYALYLFLRAPERVAQFLR